jgi:hypothetical protein
MHQKEEEVVGEVVVEVQGVQGECIHSMQGRKDDCSHLFLGMSANIRNRNTRTCIHFHHKCLVKLSCMHQGLERHKNTVEAEEVGEDLELLVLRNQNY